MPVVGWLVSNTTIHFLQIKFIVDGSWEIDLLRPIVRNNGYENNILIVS